MHPVYIHNQPISGIRTEPHGNRCRKYAICNCAKTPEFTKSMCQGSPEVRSLKCEVRNEQFHVLQDAKHRNLNPVQRSTIQRFNYLTPLKRSSSALPKKRKTRHKPGLSS